MIFAYRVFGLLVALVFWAASATANDGFAQIGIGGLVLADTDKISMDKEELYVSEKQIRVDYVFSNLTDQDVEASVMFPLPDIVIPNEYESARGLVNFERDLKFKTLVDGKPFPITLVQRAFARDKDISEELQKHGIALNGDMKDFEKHINALPTDVKQNLITIGALPRYTDDSGKEVPYPPDLYFAPQWSVKSYVTRKQLFPKGRKLSVSHSYVPVIGASVEGGVNYTKEYVAQLDQEGRENLAKDRALYCIDDDWIKAYEARVKKAGGRLGNPKWISYILSSGATWKGPIKDFRLVVDKGKQDALVSFCGDDVKKIGPTKFEVRKKDFEPKGDLNVLMVDWGKLGE